MLELKLEQIEGEARVLDTDLAGALEMKRPTNIRRFITRNRDELETFGPLHSSRAKVAIGSGAEREVEAHHLNRNQALLACILSRTPKGREIRASADFVLETT